MIFYFSGTGNSKYVAKKLAAHFNEEVVEISQKELRQKRSYVLSENERIGIVCPVYWYNLPMIAEAYLSKLEFQSYKGQYIYAVATYANSCGNMLGQLSKLLAKNGYILSGRYGVKMVDNYVVAYDLADDKKQKQILEKANKRLEEIQTYIEERRTALYIHKGSIAFMTPVLKPFYNHANHTKKFYADEKCIGCGQCERECPCEVISLKEEKPNWSGQCSFCLKCINHCPQKAIQYGKGTIKRRRYYLS